VSGGVNAKETQRSSFTDVCLWVPHARAVSKSRGPVVHLKLSTMHLQTARPAPSLRVLEPLLWREAAVSHRDRVLSLCHCSPANADGESLAGLDIDPSHPIFNFIFTYYSFDPKVLLKFSAGPGVTLQGVSTASEPSIWTGRGWAWTGGGNGAIDVRRAPKSLRRAARHAAEVMRRSSTRAPHLHCFGMHEWAMLYEPDNTAGGSGQVSRHQSLPLRVSQTELNSIVESIPIACTHFDAFRFFAPGAAPLNTVEPTPSRAAQPSLEQPGCLHATMDLFRYSLKLFPWLPSTLLADALELAISARVLDMRASPYDLSEFDSAATSAPAGRAFDLSPVRIETPDGRRAYQRGQVELASRAAPVRARLLSEYDAAIAAWDAQEAA
jgi:hypothetical protein